jgi:hypothetical protein
MPDLMSRSQWLGGGEVSAKSRPTAKHPQQQARSASADRTALLTGLMMRRRRLTLRQRVPMAEVCLGSGKSA